MVSEGDRAPAFVAPLATDDGDIETFDLAERVADGPLVLAFFPGAFTNVCTGEMTTFQDRLAELHDAGAQLYGVSVDSPFALNEFREQHDLTFGVVSDFEREAIDAYDVRDDFEDVGVHGLAERAAFVVDRNRRVRYAWVAEHPGREPDYDAVIDAARAVAGGDTGGERPERATD